VPAIADAVWPRSIGPVPTEPAWLLSHEFPPIRNPNYPQKRRRTVSAKSVRDFIGLRVPPVAAALAWQSRGWIDLAFRACTVRLLVVVQADTLEVGRVQPQLGMRLDRLDVVHGDRFHDLALACMAHTADHAAA
jgi:hypothetical protein